MLAGVVITVPYGGAQRDLYVASSGGVAGGISDKTAILFIIRKGKINCVN